MKLSESDKGESDVGRGFSPSMLKNRRHKWTTYRRRKEFEPQRAQRKEQKQREAE
ncbi:hypothetical protein [Paraglaciecola sp. L3A3]|uniref:hypothetical protein n=1 Tax=Paraglaciecola sp. L3A3 TaxID=2686358 RepID=UPI00131BEC5E|nr:hypothetical protein [Paraglaciecola sp. L3A3]